MSEPFLAEIRMFGNNFAPADWAYCSGQIMPISQNTALFSLVGTIYGGDGRSTFRLPDLQGRTPMHQGRGPGLSLRYAGERGGFPRISLDESQIPMHNHTVTGLSQKGDLDTPKDNAFLAIDVNAGYRLRFVNANPSSTTSMDSSTLSVAGNSNYHENQQPYLVVGFCIALAGLYPSRN